MSEFFYKDESYAINGAAIEVHKHLLRGYAEKVYGDALEIEFKLRGIPYKREYPLDINYKGFILPHKFIPDFICYDKIIIELKATDEILPAYEAQIINYLRVTGFHLGLLYNFNEQKLIPHRYF